MKIFWKESSKEHSCEIISKFDQRFLRRRLLWISSCHLRKGIDKCKASFFPEMTLIFLSRFLWYQLMICVTCCISVAEGGHDCFTNRHLVITYITCQKLKSCSHRTTNPTSLYLSPHIYWFLSFKLVHFLFSGPRLSAGWRVPYFCAVWYGTVPLSIYWLVYVCLWRPLYMIQYAHTIP